MRSGSKASRLFLYLVLNHFNQRTHFKDPESTNSLYWKEVYSSGSKDVEDNHRQVRSERPERGIVGVQEYIGERMRGRSASSDGESCSDWEHMGSRGGHRLSNRFYVRTITSSLRSRTQSLDCSSSTRPRGTRNILKAQVVYYVSPNR